MSSKLMQPAVEHRQRLPDRKVSAGAYSPAYANTQQPYSNVIAQATLQGDHVRILASLRVYGVVPKSILAPAGRLVQTRYHAVARHEGQPAYTLTCCFCCSAFISLACYSASSWFLRLYDSSASDVSDSLSCRVSYSDCNLWRRCLPSSCSVG